MPDIYSGVVHALLRIFRMRKIIIVREKDMAKDYKKMQNGSDF